MFDDPLAVEDLFVYDLFTDCLEFLVVVKLYRSLNVVKVFVVENRPGIGPVMDAVRRVAR